jgi:hypothetical protein
MPWEPAPVDSAMPDLGDGGGWPACEVCTFGRSSRHHARYAVGRGKSTGSVYVLVYVSTRDA